MFSSPLIQKRKPDSFLFLAEREGFEPPVPLGTSVFKTGAIDHSATSPGFFVVKGSGLSVLTLQRYDKYVDHARVLTKKCNYFFCMALIPAMQRTLFSYFGLLLLLFVTLRLLIYKLWQAFLFFCFSFRLELALCSVYRGSALGYS